MILKDLVKSKDALGRLSSQKLPINIAYRLGKTLDKVFMEIERYEKYRTSLIREIGNVSSETGDIVVPPENIPEFIKQMESLLNEEVSIDIQKIKISEMQDAMVSVEDILLLRYLIEE